MPYEAQQSLKFAISHASKTQDMKHKIKDYKSSTGYHLRYPDTWSSVLVYLIGDHVLAKDNGQ